MSETGVKSQEPVIFRFPPTYPFQAPKILLRKDFNRFLPHINPLIRAGGKEHVLPCIYDGPLNDLLHQEGDGLSELLNQLADWFGKAAIDDLIDPKQGWEPIRRDDTFGWVVYDLSGLRALVREKEGALAFQCRFWGEKDNKDLLYFCGGIDYHKPQPLSPHMINNEFMRKDSVWSSYGSLLVFIWPDFEKISNQYMPESAHNLRDLNEKAREYGCYEPLRSILIDLGWAMKAASFNRPIFPIFVILCSRRPYRLINDDSTLELIPYVIECHVDHSKLPFSESALRLREDSPVFPLGHRHALSSKLLRKMSGGPDQMEKGPIVHIGCGSVGSKIAMHLARSGHGPFKLLDKAAFSPHNAARHALIPIPDLPGQPKAIFLAEQIKMLRADAESYAGDIIASCQQSNKGKTIFPSDTRLIIETTGSLAVREFLADLPFCNIQGRLLHAGLYESGEIGLMAIEGPNRNPNVSDLVIRFWDTLIDNEDIRSKFHISFQTSSDSISRQEVGQGCGSHTMVMPDTRISIYAAGIAERARKFLEGSVSQSAELWIGKLEANQIQVSWTSFELSRTKILSPKAENHWKIRILDQALDQISKEAVDYGEIETGGVLIGRISLTRRCITISRVIEAPPDSRRSESLFVLGTEGLRTKVKEIHEKSGGFLNYVGTWHSHPKGGQPSELDKRSLERMKKLRFGAPAASIIWSPVGFHTIIDEGKLS